MRNVGEGGHTGENPSPREGHGKNQVLEGIVGAELVGEGRARSNLHEHVRGDGKDEPTSESKELIGLV